MRGGASLLKIVEDSLSARIDTVQADLKVLSATVAQHSSTLDDHEKTIAATADSTNKLEKDVRGVMEEVAGLRRGSPTLPITTHIENLTSYVAAFGEGQAKLSSNEALRPLPISSAPTAHAATLSPYQNYYHSMSFVGVAFGKGKVDVTISSKLHRPLSVGAMNIDEVQIWLRSLNGILEEFLDLIAKEKIDGAALVTFSKDETRVAHLKIPVGQWMIIREGISQNSQLVSQ